MSDIIEIKAPLSDLECRELTAGQDVLISGTIYTARDAAHKRLNMLLESGEALPFDINGAVIYYAGASPTPPGRVIGSIGPTTASRMDAYTPGLIASGMKGMIGKGPRNMQVVEAIKRHGAVYFGVVGGLAALLSKKVISSEFLAFPDLGPEAVYRLEVYKFPVKVMVDSRGTVFQPNL